jgi:hypothetical protein
MATNARSLGRDGKLVAGGQKHLCSLAISFHPAAFFEHSTCVREFE